MPSESSKKYNVGKLCTAPPCILSLLSSQSHVVLCISPGWELSPCRTPPCGISNGVQNSSTLHFSPVFDGAAVQNSRTLHLESVDPLMVGSLADALAASIQGFVIDASGYSGVFMIGIVGAVLVALCGVGALNARKRIQVQQRREDEVPHRAM